jgi:hypothetical protein
LVGRSIEKIDTKEQIEANLALEKNLHSTFGQFNGLVLLLMMSVKSQAILMENGLRTY